MAIPRDQIVSEIRTLATELSRPPTGIEWKARFHHSENICRPHGGFVALRNEAMGGSAGAHEIDPHTVPRFDARKWLDFATTAQRLRGDAHPTHRHRVVGNPKAKKPMVYVFSGDWHLGCQAVNYEKFIGDHDYLRGLPHERVRLVLVGDLIQNTLCSFRN